MKLKDLLKQLSLTTLANSAYIGMKDKTFNKSSLPKVIQGINDALVQLYTDFPIKSDTLFIKTRKGVYTYKLIADNAYTSGNPNWYISDSKIKPFTGNVIQIQSINDSHGRMLVLNDELDSRSVFITSPNEFRVMEHMTNQEISVQYQATPQLIPLSAKVDSNFEVDIPLAYERLLKLKITEFLMLALDTDESYQKAQLYIQQYEMMKQQYQSQSMGYTEVMPTNIQPRLNGFI